MTGHHVNARMQAPASHLSEAVIVVMTAFSSDSAKGALDTATMHRHSAKVACSHDVTPLAKGRHARCACRGHNNAARRKRWEGCVRSSPPLCQTPAIHDGLLEPEGLASRGYVPQQTAGTQAP